MIFALNLTIAVHSNVLKQDNAKQKFRQKETQVIENIDIEITYVLLKPMTINIESVLVLLFY